MTAKRQNEIALLLLTKKVGEEKMSRQEIADGVKNIGINANEAAEFAALVVHSDHEES